MFHAAVLTWGGKDMQELIDKITNEGVHVGGGIVKLDSFLNHQVEPGLTLRMAVELCSQFQACGIDLVTKVVTAKSVGFLWRWVWRRIWCGVDLCPQKSFCSDDRYLLCRRGYQPNPRAHTDLMVDRRFLGPDDCVLFIDDFLATGSTLSALVRLVRESPNELARIGFVIEKPAEGGPGVFRSRCTILTLATIEFVGTT
ncbi:MAG: xanthine phosphoribosyltransferase [Gammaproteobacteria bacterium]|nr:MAG: xanthine phosphoribosyltransferase [Gammaproteobacteria bacterium]